MSDQQNIALECIRLVKTFTDGGLHVEVLKGIDFKILPGQTVAIIGASGTGKSTFLQLLGGLDKPTAGSVQIAGQEMTTLTEAQKGKLRNQYLGFVYQFHHLLPEFNALENVCLPLLIRNEKIKVAKQKAYEILAKVGLENRINHRIGELSGGERQRIAIARALVTEPRCVLADEPTGNLDQGTASKVCDLMLELNESLGTSFVMVTHNQQLASRLNQVFVLAKGELQAA